MAFSILDWAILTVYLAMIFVVGINGRKYVSDSKDFLVANRSMGLHVGIISMIATEIGIITYMYYSEMGVLYGFTSFLAGIVGAAVYVVVGRTGFVIERLRGLELLTIPQFFQKRYGSDVRFLVGVLMAVGGALNFGVFPIIEATFLNIVTGIPQAYTLWTMVALIVIVLVYTALGGMVSVIVTNYFQYIVLVIGMILITFYCFYSVGWTSMVDTVKAGMGEKGFDPFAHPVFGWKFILWQTLTWSAAVTMWAPVAARTLSSESPKTVKRIFVWTGFLALGRATLPFLWGIAALAHFGGMANVSIQVTPMFLRDVLPVGISGLVVAAMLAASMSTYSGYLLAWSSIISQDVILPLIRRPLSAKNQLVLNRATVLLLALFIVVWGLFYVIPDAIYFYLQMTGNIFLAGTFWAVVGGLYWKGAHRLGAYCSMIFGASCTLIYFFVPNPQAWTGTIAVISYVSALIGMVGGSIVGTHVVSISKRILFLAALIVLVPVCFRVVESGLKSGQLWLEIWVVVLALAFLFLVVLSTVAIVKGSGDIKHMLKALMRD
jgi:SSS family solute:Na+ symporter